MLGAVKIEDGVHLAIGARTQIAIDSISIVNDEPRSEHHTRGYSYEHEDVGTLRQDERSKSAHGSRGGHLWQLRRPGWRGVIRADESRDRFRIVLKDLATGIRTQLEGRHPDCVVIKNADYSRSRGGNSDGPNHRLMAEGVLAAIAREFVDSVVISPGRDLGKMSSTGNQGLPRRLCPHGVC